MNATRTREVSAVVDAGAIRSWLDLFAEEVASHVDLLTQLDAAIGDA